MWGKFPNDRPPRLLVGLHAISLYCMVQHNITRGCTVHIARRKVPHSASSHFHMSLVHSIFLALLSHNIGWKPRHQEQRTTKHVAQIGVLFKGSLSMESIHSKRCISLVDIYIGQVFISDFKHTHTHTYTHTATQLLYWYILCMLSFSNAIWKARVS